MLEGLVARHQVRLLALTLEEPGEEGVHELKNRGIEYEWLPARLCQPNSISAVLGLVSPKPRSIVSTHRGEIAGRIEEELDGGSFDLVVASELRTAAYVRHFGGVPAILEDIECGFFAHRARHASSPVVRLRRELTNFKLRRYLRRLLGRFSACTVVSEAEKTILEDWVPGYRSIHVIPNCVRVEDYEVGFGTRESAAIFPGARSYTPNRRGIEWFQQRVLPAITSRVGDFKVYVTGGGPPPANPDSRLVLTGHLSRSGLHELFGRVKLCIVPLLDGGGTRLKILESMALGVPVVSTSLGAEGLDISAGTHLSLADSAESFSDAVVQLLADDGKRDSLAAAAREFVSCHHDCRQVLPAFLRLVDEAGEGN